jgi:hypothetical protein
MTPNKKEIKKLSTSKWIDELSEEEMIVLRKSHALDKKLANKIPVLV